MSQNAARVTTHVEIDGKVVRLEDAKVLSQLTSERATALYKEAMEKLPVQNPEMMTEIERIARNKAIAIENAFRKNGARIVRPLLHRLHEHALEIDQDDETNPMIRIDDFVIPVPNSNLKKWQANGFVEVIEDKDDEGKVYLKFTTKGVMAAQEVEK